MFNNVVLIGRLTDKPVLKTFEDDKLDGRTYVNMPYFNQSGIGSTTAQSAGIEIDETWIYNNSVYVGVKQELAGNLGFSYFY